MRYCFTLLLLAVFNFPAQAQLKATLVRNKLIMEKPVTPSSHASTITALPGGQLLAAWFGGKEEGSKDVVIWASLYKNNQWQRPVQLADGIISDTLRYPCWNPVLFRTRAGLLCLFYKIGPNPREWWGMARYSHDNGVSWSSPEKLPDGILGPIKNKCIQLPDGHLLHPSSTESVKGNVWISHMEISDSTGHQWQKININCDTFGVIQPTLLSYKDGKIQALFRSRQNVVASSWSADNGASWSAVSGLSLLNPNSGIDAVTTPDGWQVLVYNPAKSGKDWSNGRNELRVAVSKDGLQWKDVYTLEKHAGGEYSYPAIIATAGGLVHITYTSDRKNIRVVTLSLQ
ncbi:sialidase family protein [Chitinophaga eiseniae]|uniref:Exo-alpha-sialidase n=1 Tax=Chitinophaga eiseniae TaxID=634771 RepID=A0A847SCT9_9BACT|nr:sialidase family protein [Chitinophaga eiseniae]NLR77553.1 exo-alpha-sialidase [Chitinophaga eiseniae]